jgi:translation initiation factor 2 subunit 1
MSLGRPEWPEIGELVMATVKDIKGYGAYVNLDEFTEKEGLLHISEISSRWVRNIRNHIRVGQKVVLQVLRVDKNRGQIDLSFRRVTRDERRKKIEQWKKSRKAETLLSTIAASLNMDVNKLYEEEGIKIIQKYDNLYDGLEKAAKIGREALTIADVKPEIAEIIAEVAKEKIVVKRVMINGIFELSSTNSRGVEEIKEAFETVKQLADDNDAEAEVYSLGAPKYRIELTADDYKQAEVILSKIVDHTRDVWTNQEGLFSFTRE